LQAPQRLCLQTVATQLHPHAAALQRPLQAGLQRRIVFYQQQAHCDGMVDQ
jgi:hypothetical protein